MSIFIPNRSIKLPKDTSVPQGLSPSVFETHRRDQAFQLSKRFDGALVDVVSGAKATSVISGVRYGIVNGVVTEFGVNQPALEDDGFRACPWFTQYFLNNEVPVTQSITLAAGSYCLWIEGSGSATFNGLTATEGNPKVFTLASGFTGNCVISGVVTKCMLSSGLFKAPFSPTQGTVKSFVSETGSATNGTSFDIDNTSMVRLKNIFSGPNAQGHIEFMFKSNFDSSELTPGVNFTLNIINTTVVSSVHPISFKRGTDNILIARFSDGVSVASIYPLTAVRGQIFNISADWGTHPSGLRMRITVNGVKSALLPFRGALRDSESDDLRFFHSNPIHAGWIKKDSLKIYDKPRW